MSKLAKEMRELSALELNERVAELKVELFNLRFRLAINQLENPQRIPAVKKQIAVIKTLQRERELKASVGK
jgi:large subunit ribosomal protein L29